MQYTIMELKQEWDVFSALSPEKLLELYRDRQISYIDYIRMINALKVLGFYVMAEYYMFSKYEDKLEKTTNILDTIYKTDLNKLYDETGVVFSEKEFVRMFIENIKSEGLKDLFEKKADYFYEE